MKIFFTADMHFDHANIIKYCNRPWLRKGDLDAHGNWISEEVKMQRAHEMNEDLIRRWNKKVKPEDKVYHVGDWCHGNGRYWEGRVNGKVVHIRGNHDLNNRVKTYILNAAMEFGKKNIYVIHIPPRGIGEIPEGTDFVLTAHVHNNWKHKFIEGIPLINIGVDVWGYEPVSTNSILKYYHKIIKGEKNEKSER